MRLLAQNSICSSPPTTNGTHFPIVWAREHMIMWNFCWRTRAASAFCVFLENDSAMCSDGHKTRLASKLTQCSQAGATIVTVLRRLVALVPGRDIPTQKHWSASEPQVQHRPDGCVRSRRVARLDFLDRQSSRCRFITRQQDSSRILQAGNERRDNA